MATPISFNFKFILSTSLISILISLALEKGHALESRLAVENNYHTVHVSSIVSSSSSCKVSAKGPKRKASLEVVNRHGPCSQLSQHETNTPSLAEILAHDQSRVTSILRRHAFNEGLNKVRHKKAILPAKSGSSLGTGNYIVTVGLGTPKKDLSLVFDTGSDLTWTQCQPCVKFCYKQQEPIFNPSASSTYSNISCSSTQCSQLSSATGNPPRCSTSTCVYAIQYYDQSFSVGFFGKEKLTLSPTDVLDTFLFGCGQKNRGLFGQTAGLLGLGRDSLSVVSQTAQKYGKVFSYCLPTKSGSNGHLSFGKGSVPSSVKYTQFSSSQKGTFYFVDILAISVGGRQVSISQSVFQNAGTIIDSGTVITRLPPTAYSAMRDAFKKQMTKYPSAPAVSILDTCYDFSNYTTIIVPKIRFTFNRNLTVDVPLAGIFVVASQSQICLAFAGNGNDTDVGIYGNLQQQTFEIVYDVAGGKLGFGPAGCS